MAKKELDFGKLALPTKPDVVKKEETAYFITDKDCGSLRRLEWGTKQKRKVSIQIIGAGYPLPDTLNITHYTFSLQIRLTRFQKNDSSQ